MSNSWQQPGYLQASSFGLAINAWQISLNRWGVILTKTFQVNDSSIWLSITSNFTPELNTRHVHSVITESDTEIL